MDENGPVILARRRFLVMMSVSAVLLALDACTPGSSPTVPGAPTSVAAPTQSVVPLPSSPQPQTAPPANAASASAPGSSMATTPMMPTVNTVASATRPATSGTIASSPAVSGSAASGSPVSATARPMTTTTTASAGAMSGTAPAASTGASTMVASATAAGQMLVIKAVDYAFQTMSSIPGGLTTIQLQNQGKELHEAQLGRLNEGVTYDQFVAAVKSDLANNGSTSNDMATPVGGPNAVVAGSTCEVIQDLKAGPYVFVCLIPNAMGVPHAALGMISPLTVTAPTGAAVAPPTVNGTITLKDDNFDLATLPAGRSLYRVVNSGTQPADLQLLGIAPGKTLTDVTQFVSGLGMSGGAGMMAGPLPVTGGAGIATLAPGESGIVVFNLVAGQYAVWTGDPSTGIAQFTVA